MTLGIKAFLRLFTSTCFCITVGTLSAADVVKKYDDPHWLLGWGGPGFDSKQEMRFGARLTIAPTNEALILELKMDTKETAYSLNRVRLESEDSNVKVESLGRRKISRHETSPYACQFSVTELKLLPDRVLLIAFDDDGKMVLKEKISMAEIRKQLLDVLPADGVPLKRTK